MQTVTDSPGSTQTILQILDQSFQIYRENFLQFVGLTALVVVPLSVVTITINQTYLTEFHNFDFTSGRSSSISPEYSNAVLLSTVVSLVLAVLQGVFVNGIITFITSENYLGRKFTVTDAYRAGRGRFGTLLGALVLLYLILILVAIVSGIAVLCLVGVVGFAILAYFGITTSTFIVPTVMLENVNGTQGMLRAWSLGKARFWSVLGLAALIGVLTFILSFAVTVLGQLVTGQGPAVTSLPGSIIFNGFLSMLASVLVAPLAPITFTLLYYDTRIRLEGLDVALRAVEKPDVRPFDVVSPPPKVSITGNDVVNVLVLLGIGTVIILIFAASMGALLNALLPNLSLQ